MTVRIPKVILLLTVAALVLMAGLVVTGLALSTRSASVRASEPEPVGIEAMMSLSPTYGGANTLVNITGIGYPENARVRLFLTSPSAESVNLTPQGEALTDDMGRFSVMFQMPQVWPDGAPITDEQLVLTAVTEDGSVRAVANFDFIPPVIQPEITISPAIGGGGTAVTVSSTGFPAGAQVQLHLGPPEGGYGPTVYGQGVADASGAVNIAFSMPDNWADGSRVKDEQLEIVAITADGATRATSGFDYVPVPHPLMAVTPNYGGPGTPVSITGDGYPAGVRVLIKTGTSVEDAASRPAYVETMADTRGLINIPFEMPGTWSNGLPILTRDVVVLATASDRSGYGWMGFAYLSFAAPEETEEEAIQQGTGSEEETDETQPETTGGQQPAGESVVVEEELLQPDEQAPLVEDAPQVEEQLVVQPFITLLPEEGSPASMVEVTGSGFPANAPVTLLLTTPDGLASTEPLGEAMTDGGGLFSLTFELPAAWPDGTAIQHEELLVNISTGDTSPAATAILRYLLAAET